MGGVTGKGRSLEFFPEPSGEAAIKRYESETMKVKVGVGQAHRSGKGHFSLSGPPEENQGVMEVHRRHREHSMHLQEMNNRRLPNSFPRIWNGQQCELPQEIVWKVCLSSWAFEEILYICRQRYILGSLLITATYRCHAHTLDHLAPQQTCSRDISLPFTAEFPPATQVVSSEARLFSPQESKLRSLPPHPY